jgi:hypothetical protein
MATVTDRPSTPVAPFRPTATGLGSSAALPAYAAGPAAASNGAATGHADPAITVRAGQDAVADFPGADNRALQAAVDYVASLGGGTVEIGPGTYLMRDSLHLRSGVTVCGTANPAGGPSLTILQKAASSLSRLVLDGDYGEEQITLADPSGFQPGYGVAIWDQRSGGFHTTVGRLLSGPHAPTVPEEALGTTFRIDTPHGADYLVSREATAATVFPVVSGYHVRGARLQHLTIEGNRAKNAPLNGCRGGGIFLYRGHGTHILDCTVRDYNGDGISFQQSDDVHVERCVVSGNAQLGIHPGSGSQRPVVTDCHSFENGTIGLFLCWRVRGGRFENNLLERNGRIGISIGHKDTDNLFVKNRSVQNGRYGILFRDESAAMSGHRNRFVECEVADNATNSAEGEGADVRLEGGTQGIVFERCAIAGEISVGPNAQAPQIVS